MDEQEAQLEELLCCDLEGGMGQLEGGGSKRRRHMYMCGRFTLLYNRDKHNIIKQLEEEWDSKVSNRVTIRMEYHLKWRTLLEKSSFEEKVKDQYYILSLKWKITRGKLDVKIWRSGERPGLEI